ncbi:interleukin-17 receptor B [Elgaria multicarinata webbii]|uniref:interleukin-17 receptor B n=1 Tax=Elgaria multicarinata webbii TaxID=159646 RepID=UPI002FCD4B6B
MDAAVAWVLLGAALSDWSTAGEAQPSITCHEENGPSPQLMMHHKHTPSDLSSISVEIVEIQGNCQLNITWIINADASIKHLSATKICMTLAHQECIRCDYTEEFPGQIRHDGQKWQFQYIGFSVEENKDYRINAFNLPPANINEDHPRKYIMKTSPDCQDNVLKYCNTCIEKGSLWDPNITVCYMESEVEVNFTTSRFCPTYRILICDPDPDSDDCSDHTVNTDKRNDTRISERIQMTGQKNKIFQELIPHFPKCGNDCRRYFTHQILCSEEPTNASILRYICILAASFLIVCIVAAVVYSKRRHGAVNNWAVFHPTVQKIPATILVVYSQEVCFQHIVLVFAEFLHECCQSNVVIDVWQKRRIAEIGPVQWLTTQKEIADKVIFLSPCHTSPTCDSACKTTIESHKNSECMFTLAFNLFCSDLKNQFSLHKYMVVSFNETNPAKSIPSPLNICPRYFLMKDIDSFCRDLCLSQSPRCDGETKSKCSWRFKMKRKLQVPRTKC